VKIFREEEGVAARRLLAFRQALDAFADQIVVPTRCVPHVEAEMRQADLIPRPGPGRKLRLKREDLQRPTARDTNPSNLAARLRAADAKKTADAIRRRVGHADQRATEDIPVELNRLVEVGHRD